MIRPPSIVKFQWLYLASVVLGLLSTVLGWSQSHKMLAENPVYAEHPEFITIGLAMAVVVIAISIAIVMVLWWLIAFKANEVAKWILVVLTGLGFVLMLFGLFVPSPTHGTIAEWTRMLSWAPAVAAIVFLFMADANAWFKVKDAPLEPPSTADFE